MEIKATVPGAKIMNTLPPAGFAWDVLLGVSDGTIAVTLVNAIGIHTGIRDTVPGARMGNNQTQVGHAIRKKEEKDSGYKHSKKAHT